MKKIILFFVFFIAVKSINAQIEEGGIPVSFTKNLSFDDIPLFTTPLTDIAFLRTQDAVHDTIKDIPWRYGYVHDVNLSFEDGVYDYLPNGDRIWRINIASANAQTLNITFDKYKLDFGAKLFIYNENKILGAFTSKNNKEHGYLATTLIEGEQLIIELYEPKSTFGKNQLHISKVVNGYRSLDYKNKLKGVGDSGDCNNNVICSVGDNWRDQIRSVGILLLQNNYSAGFCSGALINNTCNDGTPYFLTANHCVDGQNPNTIVVGFNFESIDCSTDNWAGDNHTISGTTQLAVNAGSDFALLELSSTPPANYNVFYAGWDHSTNISSSQVAIHHPSGDLKKISFDTDAPTMSTYSSALCWRIGDWDDGTTEGGSSGSPLFNQDGNIIGQLYGGSASCTSITNDFYGRFDISWDNGSGPTDELQSWLDSCNTGVEVLAGYDPNEVLLNDDAMISFNYIPSTSYCGEKIAQIITVTNKGFNDITSFTFDYGLNGNLSNYNWQGTLTSNQSVEIDLDSLNLSSGNYTYEAYLNTVNLVQDENQSNDTVDFDFSIENGFEVEINITTNFDGSENYFTITDENDIIIEEEGPFGQLESYSYNYCLTNGSYCITMYDDGGDGLEPTFFSLDPGNYQLIVNSQEIYNGDDFGTGYEYCFDVDINTNISDQESFDKFIVYPNPNNGSFSIQSSAYIYQIEIINVLGSKVYHQLVNNTSFNIQLNNLSQGIYFVKVFTDKGTGLERIIVK